MFALLPRVLHRVGIRAPIRIFATHLNAARSLSLSTPLLAAAKTATKKPAASTVSKPKPKSKVATTKAKTTTTRGRKPPAAKKTTARKPTIRKAKAAAKRKVAPKKPKKAVKKPVVYKPVHPAYPPRPKMPGSAYNFFIAENKTRFGFGGPGGIGVASVKAGEAWKALPAAEKQVYLNRAQEAKAAYEVQKAEWFKGITPDVARAINRFQKSKGKRVIKFPNPIDTPRPMSSFFLYLHDNRTLPGAMDAAPTTSGTSAQAWLTKEVAKAWNSMSDAEKEPYRERSLKMRAAYKAAWEA